MFKRILVALETLTSQHPALVKARALFPQAQLHLLHVLPLPQPLPVGVLGAGYFAPRNMQDELNLLAEAQAQLTELGEGEVLYSAFPAAEILRRANSGDFDLVVLSASTKGTLERLMLGSVANNVVHDAQIPVMTVRHSDARQQGGPVRRILVLHNFTPPAAQALTAVHHAFPQAEVEVLHVVPEGSITTPMPLGGTGRVIAAAIAQQRQQEWVTGIQHKMEAIGGGVVVEGQPAHTALAELADGSYDLVALGISDRGALDRLFFGSVAQQVLRESPVPVLTVDANWEHHLATSHPDLHMGSVERGS